MQKTIKHTLFFQAPPSTVWDYLTKPELMSLWLMNNDFQPVIGHDFQFNTNPVPSLDFDGIVYCKVLEIIPHKKLTYSWKCGPGKGIISIDSLVVWTLLETNDGTQLTLENSGFKEMDNFNINIYNAMNQGWLQNMQKIPALIETAKV